MREIITLQLGSLSNHVGTHFWNAQVKQSNQKLESCVLKRFVLH
jgi:hypothetical protein